MYLSCLLIDVGADPDRPRPGRFWLHDRYHVHQRLCMAFPSADRKSVDPYFLMPFDPKEFGTPDDQRRSQVHVQRAADAGFLFRVDPEIGGRVIIVVQSGSRPDWDYGFHNAGHLLAAVPQVREFEPSFSSNQRLRFRLVANPTRKIDTKSGPDGQKRNGRRVPVPADQLVAWLCRKSDTAGFSVEMESIVVQPGYVRARKGTDSKGFRLFAVTYDGYLKVDQPEMFREVLSTGIGAGKAFGFGMLSVAAAN